MFNARCFLLSHPKLTKNPGSVPRCPYHSQRIGLTVIQKWVGRTIVAQKRSDYRIGISKSLTTFTNSFLLLYFLVGAWAQGELCFFFPCYQISPVCFVLRNVFTRPPTETNKRDFSRLLLCLFLTSLGIVLAKKRNATEIIGNNEC